MRSSSKRTRTSGSIHRRNSFKFTLQSNRLDDVILAAGRIVVSAIVSTAVTFAVFGSWLVCVFGIAFFRFVAVFLIPDYKQNENMFSNFMNKWHSPLRLNRLMFARDIDDSVKKMHVGGT